MFGCSDVWILRVLVCCERCRVQLCRAEGTDSSSEGGVEMGARATTGGLEVRKVPLRPQYYGCKNSLIYSCEEYIASRYVCVTASLDRWLIIRATQN